MNFDLTTNRRKIGKLFTNKLQIVVVVVVVISTELYRSYEMSYFISMVNRKSSSMNVHLCLKGNNNVCITYTTYTYKYHIYIYTFTRYNVEALELAIIS